MKYSAATGPPVGPSCEHCGQRHQVWTINISSYVYYKKINYPFDVWLVGTNMSCIPTYCIHLVGYLLFFFLNNSVSADIEYKSANIGHLIVC